MVATEYHVERMLASDRREDVLEGVASNCQSTRMTPRPLSLARLLVETGTDREMIGPDRPKRTFRSSAHGTSLVGPVLLEAR